MPRLRSDLPKPAESCGRPHPAVGLKSSLRREKRGLARSPETAATGSRRAAPRLGSGNRPGEGTRYDADPEPARWGLCPAPEAEARL